MAFTFGGKGQSYPAGPNPYNGQPIQVKPAYNAFMPGAPSAPGAEELNWIFRRFERCLQRRCRYPGLLLE